MGQTGRKRVEMRVERLSSPFCSSSVLRSEFIRTSKRLESHKLSPSTIQRHRRSSKARRVSLTLSRRIFLANEERKRPRRCLTLKRRTTSALSARIENTRSLIPAGTVSPCKQRTANHSRSTFENEFYFICNFFFLAFAVYFVHLSRILFLRPWRKLHDASAYLCTQHLRSGRRFRFMIAKRYWRYLVELITQTKTNRSRNAPRQKARSCRAIKACSQSALK